MKQLGFLEPVDGFRHRVDAPTSRERREGPQIGKDRGVELMHRVALQAALDFFRRQALGSSASHLCLGPPIAAYSSHRDCPQGVAFSTIAAPVQPMARRLSG